MLAERKEGRGPLIFARVQAHTGFFSAIHFTYGRLRLDCTVPSQINMMMFDMHPDTAKHFYKEACPTGREMTKKTGIAELVPGAVVDDFAFDPCGCVALYVHTSNEVLNSVSYYY